MRTWEILRLRFAPRRMAVFVAGSALVLALTGCAQSPPYSPPPPTVGTCFDLETSIEIDTISNSNPSVACDSLHTSQTYYTTTVTGDYADWTDRPIAEILSSLQYTLCKADDLRTFVGAVDRDSLTNVSIQAYFPTEADWKAGSRTVACNVTVNGGANGLPQQIYTSLSDVMGSQASATLRTCYVQEAAADGMWVTSGETTTCDQPHSSQDINAWLPALSGDVPAANISEQCQPYVEQFLGAPLAGSGYQSTGILVKQDNGTYSLHCAIGGDSGQGNTTAVLVGHR